MGSVSERYPSSSLLTWSQKPMMYSQSSCLFVGCVALSDTKTHLREFSCKMKPLQGFHKPLAQCDIRQEPERGSFFQPLFIIRLPEQTRTGAAPSRPPENMPRASWQLLPSRISCPVSPAGMWSSYSVIFNRLKRIHYSLSQDSSDSPSWCAMTRKTLRDVTGRCVRGPNFTLCKI